MTKKTDTAAAPAAAPAPWQKKPETSELPIPPVAPAATSEAPKADPTEAEVQAKAKADLEAQAQAKADLEAAAQAKAPIPQPTAEPAGEPVVMVTVTVPKAFKLRIDHHKVVEYKAGVQEMPLEHADHWYSKANKVKKYTK